MTSVTNAQNYRVIPGNDKIRNLVTTIGCQRLAKEVLMTERLAVPDKIGMPFVSCHC